MSFFAPPNFFSPENLRSFDRETLWNLLLQRLDLLEGGSEPDAVFLERQVDVNLNVLAMLLAVFRDTPTSLQWIIQREVDLFKRRYEECDDLVPWEAWNVTRMDEPIAEVVFHARSHGLNTDQCQWYMVPFEGVYEILRGDCCCVGISGCKWMYLRGGRMLVSLKDPMEIVFRLYHLHLDRSSRKIPFGNCSEILQSFFKELQPVVHQAMQQPLTLRRKVQLDRMAQLVWDTFQKMGPKQFFQSCTPCCMNTLANLYWKSQRGHCGYHDRMTLVRFFFSLGLDAPTVGEMYVTMFLWSKTFARGGWTREQVERHSDYGIPMVNSMKEKCRENLWCSSVRVFHSEGGPLCPFADIEECEAGVVCGYKFQQQFPGRWPVKKELAPVTSPSQYTRASVYCWQSK